MSGKDGDKPNEGSNANTSRQTPLLGARALLSRHLSSGSSPSPGRLPSLRPARDLTLGATPRLNLNSTPKRTFTPNIPTRRIKQEPRDETGQTPENPGGRRRQDRGRGRDDRRGRGRGDRGKPVIVQSASIFSMGVGPAERQKMGQASGTSFGSGGARDGVSGVKIKKERNDDVDGDESKRVLEMLKTSGDIDEDMEQEGGSLPVQLPLSYHAIKMKEKETESSAATEIDIDIKVKSEPLDIDLENAEKSATEQKATKPVKQAAVKKEETKEATISSLLTSNSTGEEKLLFFQFPDVLPIKAVSGNQEEPMAVDQQSNDQQTPKKTKDHSKLSLRDASEGYIGKLQILRSGKARLSLGHVSLDVTMGTPCGFLQDVIAVHTEENRSDMIALGHVSNRLICTPAFEQLLTS